MRKADAVQPDTLPSERLRKCQTQADALGTTDPGFCEKGFMDDMWAVQEACASKADRGRGRRCRRSGGGGPDDIVP